MKISMPKPAVHIIQTLSSHGYEAYIVGGCVRDSILGLTPSDWDITTSARPDQIKALFPRTIDTGIKHGTVTVMVDKEGYEVTTYRIDGLYEDHRRPSDVTFTSSLREDLMRRDFTINAMAYNEEEGLVDLFGGMKDLENRTIRCVGKATDRFNEDALRMLRAVRFAGQLHFTIEQETRQAIIDCHQNLKDVSAERIQMELLKLLISDHPEFLREAFRTGLTSVFLPEFDTMMATPQNNPHHCYTVGEHTIHAVCHAKPNPVIRLTLLLHDVAKPMTKSTDQYGVDHFSNHYRIGAEKSKEILKRLKFDNQTIQIVSTLIYHHDIRFKDPKVSGRRHVRKVMHSVGPNLFPYLLDVMEADVSAQSDYYQAEKLSILAETREACDEILKAGDCLGLKDLKINGNQLKALGIREGKIIGSILNALLSMVLEHPKLNESSYLEELALNIYEQLRQKND
ncbi:MAG: CCA tRNA nucleotidyltransferase [Eubacteriales bacterium]|nr:CCA tRNA nucleotidyltransferase [Eubacteriales bacterium]